MINYYNASKYPNGIQPKVIKDSIITKKDSKYNLLSISYKRGIIVEDSLNDLFKSSKDSGYYVAYDDNGDMIFHYVVFVSPSNSEPLVGDDIRVDWGINWGYYFSPSKSALIEQIVEEYEIEPEDVIPYIHINDYGVYYTHVHYDGRCE